MHCYADAVNQEIDSADLWLTVRSYCQTESSRVALPYTAHLLSVGGGWLEKKRWKEGERGGGREGGWLVAALWLLSYEMHCNPEMGEVNHIFRGVDWGIKQPA